MVKSTLKKYIKLGARCYNSDDIYEEMRMHKLYDKWHKFIRSKKGIYSDGVFYVLEDHLKQFLNEIRKK